MGVIGTQVAALFWVSTRDVPWIPPSFSSLGTLSGARGGGDPIAAAQERAAPSQTPLLHRSWYSYESHTLVQCLSSARQQRFNPTQLDYTSTMPYISKAVKQDHALIKRSFRRPREEELERRKANKFV
jgi:hypothetical protein